MEYMASDIILPHHLEKRRPACIFGGTNGSPCLCAGIMNNAYVTHWQPDIAISGRGFACFLSVVRGLLHRRGGRQAALLRLRAYAAGAEGGAGALLPPHGGVSLAVPAHRVPTKIPVYIIGHSFGGWNAAHLCRRLADGGYNVRMLVTLDPVGGGLVSRIGHGLYARPQVAPHAAFWVNVSCRPRGGNVSDVVASLGRRWYPQAGPDVYHESPRSHADVQAMFTEAVWQGRSALDMLEADIRDCLL